MPTDDLTTGVYAICNYINRKVYVGSASSTFERRRRSHWLALKRGVHHNKHLQAAWNKYGDEEFVFVVLERCSPGRCIQREQWWIDALSATDPQHGYNMAPVAGSMLGFIHPEESRAKIAAKATGRKFSEEARESISEARKRTWSDEEYRERLSRRHKERYKDKAAYETLLEMNRRRWNNPEARKRQSEAIKAARRRKRW